MGGILDLNCGFCCGWGLECLIYFDATCSDCVVGGLLLVSFVFGDVYD